MSTVFKKTAGSCNGRGFSTIDANGLCSKFYDWITAPPVSGGPGWYIVDDQSTLLTNPFVVVSDTNPTGLQPNDFSSSPSSSPPKFLKVGYLTSEGSYIRINSYMWWTGQGGTGYGLWNGFRIRSVDAGEFIYDFRGGAECMQISTITDGGLYCFLIDEWDGLPSVLEDETHVAAAASGFSNGSNVVIQMNPGDELNFTSGKYYYLTDFNLTQHVEYAVCVGVDSVGHTITINSISSPFPSGTVIGSYPHRFYVSSNGAQETSGLSAIRSQIPYYSDGVGYIFQNPTTGAMYHGICAPAEYRRLFRVVSYYGQFLVQKPILFEIYRPNTGWNQSGMNMFYGTPKNLYIGYDYSYVNLQDGVTLNSKNYLKFLKHSDRFQSGRSEFAILILDTESDI